MTASWFDFVARSHILDMLQAVFLVIFGYFLARFLAKSTKKFLSKNVSVHQAMLIRRFIFYLIFFIFLASAIQHVGFHIGTLLGAAGILTAAIGFASQTSMSNMISGIFIIGERPFQVGDTVKINEIQGVVFAIDLLSVKIRMSDNTMARVPNETLIKAPIVNLSFFTTRRIDLKIFVANSQDISTVKKILLEVAHQDKLCLKDPKPVVTIQNFSDSAVELQYSVWAKRDEASELKHHIYEEAYKTIQHHGIQLPTGGYTLYTNPAAEPLPIKIIE